MLPLSASPHVPEEMQTLHSPSPCLVASVRYIGDRGGGGGGGGDEACGAAGRVEGWQRNKCNDDAGSGCLEW